MKATDNFKNTIKSHLEKIALNDLLFAETIKKPNKNIDDCITYILNTVQKSGCNGFEDDEIFSMAIHYYDEDIISIGKSINSQVIINHKVKSDKKETEKPKEIKKKEELKPLKQISLFD